MEGKLISLILLYIAISIGIWLLLREVMCWYFKINQAISLQKRTNELLEQLIRQNNGMQHKEKSAVRNEAGSNDEIDQLLDL